MSSTTYAASDPNPATYVFQCVPIVENNTVITEVEDEADVCAITRSKAKAKENSDSEQGKGDSTKKGEDVAKSHERVPGNDPSSSLDRRTPAYTYESKAMNPAVTKQTFSKVLDVIVPSITVSDLLAISPDLRKEAVCQVQVYSGRGSSQVQMKVDKGQGQGAGQGVSLAGVGDHLDSTTKDNER